ncbi:hypothetical protein IAT38_004593 [Cryptococcus sp. DSM 104549]
MSLNSFIEEIDWDQFLVETDLGDNSAANVVSPAPSTSTLGGNSTESDQSVALDPQPAFNFNFGFGAPFQASPQTGVAHRLENIFTSPSESPEVANAQLSSDAFGGLFQGFDFSGLTQPAEAPLPAPAPAPVAAPAETYGPELMAAIAQLMGSATPAAAPEPTLAPAPAPVSMKRKASEVSEDGAPAPKRRGRPPGSGKAKTVALPGADKRRQASKASPGSASLSPSSSTGALPADMDESDDESDVSPVKLTATGKPSTDRPKSVVPAKFLKDGSAQAILGMTIPEIMSFPTFEELLKKVQPSLLEGAKDFGEKIADNRDKAKDAAKKSRDERRAKIERAEYLEKKVVELEDQVKAMSSFLTTLVDLNVLSKDQIKFFA